MRIDILKEKISYMQNTSLFTKETLLEIYDKMLLLRRFEEKAGQLYGMGMIGGFCHLYIGQEAVALGIEYAAEEKDSIITSYRDHGFILARGSDPEAVMAELMGKSTGCSKGKGGSMHIFDIAKRFFGGHGIVGAQVSLGTGIGFSFKYRKEPNVSITLFGDGAVNQGQVYESFNMARLWNLPVLYIIENNEYSMGTPVSRGCSTIDLWRRGQSFDIPGEEVDGMDFFAVYEAVKQALDYIRSGNGPMILEMKTYRYKGHSMSDPGKYRDKDEVETFKDRDPINQIKQILIAEHKIDEDTLKSTDKRIRQEIVDIVTRCEAAPLPAPKELYTDVSS
jgi:pyruvate dehydrogenase E1 component alpha subunit